MAIDRHPLNVSLDLGELEVSTDPLPLPWPPIDPYLKNKYCISLFTLRSTLISLLVPRIRPFAVYFLGFLRRFLLGILIHGCLLTMLALFPAG
jgi:hypothetical protein